MSEASKPHIEPLGDGDVSGPFHDPSTWVPRPQSRPPEGYETFLVNATKRKQREQDWMVVALTDVLKMRGCSLVEQATIRRAAELALVGLKHGGFELSIDEWGELRYVTT